MPDPGVPIMIAVTSRRNGHWEVLPEGYCLAEYRIDALLGQGGFSKVYRATDTLLNRPVVIKEYLPSQIAVRDGAIVQPRTSHEAESFQWGLQRFLGEARLLARIAHPHVVQVLRVLEANNTAYFTMPFEEGADLSSVLKARNSLAEPHVRKILGCLLDALETLHEQGIYHRDIKPKNVIIRPGLNPLLIDFGAARTALGSHTHTLHRLLSVGYSPVEQYSDDVPAGAYTDFYALGALCYQMISASRPVDAPTRAAACARGAPDPLRSAREAAKQRYHPALLDSIDWALALSPQDRPQQVADWRRALAPGERASTTTASRAASRRTTPPPTASRSQQRARAAPTATPPGRHTSGILAASGIALVVAILAAGLVLLNSVLSADGAAPATTPTVAVAPARPTAPSGESGNTPTANSPPAAPTRAVPDPAPAPAPTAATSPSPPAPLSPGDQLEVRILLQIAESFRSKNVLVSAGSENAVAAYREVLRLDPRNARASQGLAEIAEIFERRGRQAMGAGNYQQAAAHVAQGLAAVPTDRGLMELHREIQGLR